MKSKYWVMENRSVLWFSNKLEAGKVSANYQRIPDGYSAFHLEHHYPDRTTISFHLDQWERMGAIIKEIP